MDSTAAATLTKKPQSTGVKETVESILVAFILAFIFRAFVVEAFVIPTGSMAPTLMGAHMQFDCPDCKYHWKVNYSAAQQGDDMIVPSRAVTREGVSRVFTIFCPNCGYRLPRTNPADPDNVATAPPIQFGDRILVLKYLYLFADPARWDVVVFKSPSEPDVHHYTQNYIKRLVGKPNESVMLVDGDVYIGQQNAPLDQYQIQTKALHAQEALWRIVYDNDYQPAGAGQPRVVLDKSGNVARTEPTWQQPWVEQTGGSGWNTGSNLPGQRRFTFNNPAGGSTLTFQPVANSTNHPLTNWLGYNVTMSQFHGRAPDDSYLWGPFDTPVQVSDLKLRCFYQRQAGQGPLRLSLSKNDFVFTAEILPDRIRLLRQKDGGGEEELSQAPWSAPARQTKIEFMNVDYRVALRIDDAEVLATTPQQYQPDLPTLLAAYQTRKAAQSAKISITAAAQTATLEHVSLWRDVYYTNESEPGAAKIVWGTPDMPIHLGPDEFFVLGDNSSSSLDARYWSYPIELPNEDLEVQSGRVPARFMLGKAFFVYWPAGHRLSPINAGIVPNVGEMRFIR